MSRRSAILECGGKTPLWLRGGHESGRKDVSKVKPKRRHAGAVQISDEVANAA
jgi:hypothetical protein